MRVHSFSPRETFLLFNRTEAFRALPGQGKDYTNNSENMHGHLLVDITCSEKCIVFQERRFDAWFRRTDYVQGHTSAFSKSNPGQCLSLNISRKALIIRKLGKITRILLRLSWGIFSCVTCLDQLRASENI